MGIKQSVATYLASKATVTAVTGQRIRCSNLLEGDTYPAIVVRKVDGGHEHDLDGSAGSALPRVRVISWAETDAGAESLAEIVRLVMQGYRGTMGSHTVHATILIGDSDEIPDVAEDGGDVHAYAVVHDYLIRHDEAIPSF